MHIKNNMFENIFNTMMNVEGKTKDNMKSIMDITLFCHHKNMELVYDGILIVKPKDSFVLDKNAQESVFS
jgi:threonine aldolase